MLSNFAFSFSFVELKSGRKSPKILFQIRALLLKQFLIKTIRGTKYFSL